MKGLFNALGITVPNYKLLNREFTDIFECSQDEHRNVLVSASVLGLIEDLNPQGYVTRGEFCSWVYKLKNLTEEDLKVLDIQVLNDLNVVFLEEDTSDSIKNMSYECLGNIPIPVLEKFDKLGWDLYLSNDLLMNIYKNSEIDVSSASGLCSYNRKELYVTYNWVWDISSTLYHEFGHFTKYYYFNNNKYNQKIRELYNLEKDKLAELRGRDYCCKDADEFFAEAFAVVIGYDTDKMEEKAKQYIPLTFEDISNVLDSL